MVFIIDAHLPKSICKELESLSHEAIHTKDLELGNRTPDDKINEMAIKLNACVISKDEDFYRSFLLHRIPPKLVMVKVGNMRLKGLLELFKNALPQILDILSSHDLIELHNDKIIGID